VVLIVKAEGAAMIESRRLTKEADRLRKLAESEETSRLNALREDVVARLEKLQLGVDHLQAGENKARAAERAPRVEGKAPAGAPESGWKITF
jgi:hypothetical protein